MHAVMLHTVASVICLHDKRRDAAFATRNETMEDEAEALTTARTHSHGFSDNREFATSPLIGRSLRIVKTGLIGLRFPGNVSIPYQSP